LPIGIGQFTCSYACRPGTTGIMDQHIQNSEVIQNFSNQLIHTVSCTDICPDKQFRPIAFEQQRSRRWSDRRSTGCETTDERLAAAARSIEAAVDSTLNNPASRTVDLGGKATTRDFASAVTAALKA